MEFTEVSYEELPGFPGLRTFRCEPLRASLSAESCAGNVQRRQNIQCSRCPVGAVHAANCAPQCRETELVRMRVLRNQWLANVSCRGNANAEPK